MATGADPAAHARKMQDLGAGEILLTSIDRDGTWEGYDLELIEHVKKEISIPLVASGGAGSIEDFAKAVKSGASAVASGSMVVYSGKNRGVLIRFPSQEDLRKVLA